MSRFYASIKGARGEATRTGAKTSGITGHIRGWNIGVEVTGHATVADDDEFSVEITGGSQGRITRKTVATVTTGHALVLYDPRTGATVLSIPLSELK